MRYRFDRFELDTLQFALRLGASDIHIEPLVFDLLRFLVERAGQVVTRDIIVEHVWHGRFVSDATISSASSRRVRRSATTAVAKFTSALSAVAACSS